MHLQKEKQKSQQGNAALDEATNGAEIFLHLARRKIVLFLFAITGLLLAAHLASYYIRPFVSTPIGDVLDSLFNMSRENNFPSYFSSFLLLLAALLLYAVHLTAKAVNEKWQLHWKLLSFVLLFLSLDEAVQIHERLTKVSVAAFSRFNLDYLFFAWVIPYTILFLVVVAFFLRFVLALTARTRLLFFAAGVVYIGGALGFEFLEGHEVSRHGFSATYWLMTTVEEVLEMSGVIILICALLDCLHKYKAAVLISR